MRGGGLRSTRFSSVCLWFSWQFIWEASYPGYTQFLIPTTSFIICAEPPDVYTLQIRDKAPSSHVQASVFHKGSSDFAIFYPFFHSCAWLVTNLLPRLIPGYRVKPVNKERHLKTMYLDIAFSSWEGFCLFSIICVKMAHKITVTFFKITVYYFFFFNF